MPWSPQERLGDTRWKLNVEATALGVAQRTMASRMWQ